MTFEVELPRELQSAAAAREAVSELAGRLPAEVVGDVRLLVSELVTNALRHGGLSDEDQIVLAVRVSNPCVRVEVRHPGSGFQPHETTADPEDMEGWGLYLVSTLADRWGVEGQAGTLVWFELDRAPDSDEVAA